MTTGHQEDGSHKRHEPAVTRREHCSLFEGGLFGKPGNLHVFVMGIVCAASLLITVSLFGVAVRYGSPEATEENPVFIEQHGDKYYISETHRTLIHSFFYLTIVLFVVYFLIMCLLRLAKVASDREMMRQSVQGRTARDPPHEAAAKVDADDKNNPEEENEDGPAGPPTPQSP